jgi:Cu+-exporting ATPase
MPSLTLNVTGMTCSHCRATVEKAINAVPGVYGASVDPATGRVEVDGDSRVEVATLIAAIEAAGYGAAVEQ